MNEQRWQDRVVAVLGLYAFFSPWIIQSLFPASEPSALALWNFWLCGGAVVLLATLGLTSDYRWAGWTICFIGAWLIIAPWLADYANASALAVSSITVGAAIIILSGSTIMRGSGTSAYKHE